MKKTVFRNGTENLRYAIGNDAQFYIDTKIKNSHEVYTMKMRDYFIH